MEHLRTPLDEAEAHYLESLVEISLVFPVHASEEALEEYAFGRLNGDHLDAVDDHLLVCDSCRGELVRTEADIKLMRVGLLQPRRSWLALAGDWWDSLREGIPTRTAVQNATLMGAGALALLGLVGTFSLSHRAPPATAMAALQSYRGGEVPGGVINQAPASRALDFKIRAEDVPAAPEYTVEVVTEAGRKMWTGPAQVSGGQLTAHLDHGLQAGLYWVRLYGQNSQLLSEFGLRAE